MLLRTNRCSIHPLIGDSYRLAPWFTIILFLQHEIVLILYFYYIVSTYTRRKLFVDCIYTGHLEIFRSVSVSQVCFITVHIIYRIFEKEREREREREWKRKSVSVYFIALYFNYMPCAQIQIMELRLKLDRTCSLKRSIYSLYLPYSYYYSGNQIYSNWTSNTIRCRTRDKNSIIFNKIRKQIYRLQAMTLSKSSRDHIT